LGKRPKSTRWHVNTIGFILSRAALYAGGEWSYTVGDARGAWVLPPIITRRVAAAVKARRTRANERRGYHDAHAYVLQGLITCPCGCRWHARVDRRGSGPKRYYRCHVDYARHPDCVNSIRAEEVEAQVIGAAVAFLHPFTLPEDHPDARRWVTAAPPHGSGSAPAIRLELAALEAERDTLVAAVARGVVDDDDAATVLRDLRERRTALLADLADAQAAAKGTAGEPPVTMAEVGITLTLALQHGTTKQRAAAVRRLVNWVVVHRGADGSKVVEVTWRPGLPDASN
jgi:hypothetical protein